MALAIHTYSFLFSNSALNNNLGHGQIAFEVIDGEPYVKVGADAVPKKFASTCNALQVYWQSASHYYLRIPTNGHDVKISFPGTSPTMRESLRFYSANSIDSTGETLLSNNFATETTSTFSVKQYNYLICRTGTGTTQTFNTLVEWV